MTSEIGYNLGLSFPVCKMFAWDERSNVAHSYLPFYETLCGSLNLSPTLTCEWKTSLWFPSHCVLWSADTGSASPLPPHGSWPVSETTHTVSSLCHILSLEPSAGVFGSGMLLEGKWLASLLRVNHNLAAHSLYLWLSSLLRALFLGRQMISLNIQKAHNEGRWHDRRKLLLDCPERAVACSVRLGQRGRWSQQKSPQDPLAVALIRQPHTWPNHMRAFVLMQTEPSTDPCYLVRVTRDYGHLRCTNTNIAPNGKVICIYTTDSPGLQYTMMPKLCNL